MKKLIFVFFIVIPMIGVILPTHAQTRVISLTPAGQQRVINLDSMFLKKGTMSFFEGTETGQVLLNADKKSYLKIWIAPDTIQLNNGRINSLTFVFQDSLGTLTNDWTAHASSDVPAFGTPMGIFKTDSSQVINIGGEPHRQYILYWAQMKYRLGPRSSAGVQRRLIYNFYYSPTNSNWPASIPYQEVRRWLKRL
jgi:hypothetical protein